MQSDVEVRFYRRSRFRGAKRDAAGWYVSVDFLSIGGGTEHLDYDQFVILKQVQLPSRYVGSLIAKVAEKSTEAEILYDGTTLSCVGTEYGDVLGTFEVFLRDALQEQPISLKRC